jgi:16S rRNA (cytosine967-C5)-methyltransferase
LNTEPRLHANLVEAVVNTLHEIFFNKKYADKAIERTLQSNKKWGARDRGFIAENTYEIVRWWRLINETGQLTPSDLQALWEVFGVWWLLRGNTLPEWKEFKGISSKKVQENYEKIKNIRKVKESIPDWMDELGIQELGSRWDKELAALNIPAEVILRSNTIKISKNNLLKQLSGEKMEVSTLANYPEAIVLLKRQNIFSSPSFKEGYFEVQDASSQLVAPWLDVKPGMRVIDACAGGGGKTLHMAALMQNKGRIIALDTEEWKLANLRKRATRAGISIIETRLIDSAKVIKRLQDSADRILLDVPCSGLGVLKRNPDAKWKLTPEFIDSIRKTQQEILQSYATVLKSGGKLVYSTCSILDSENTQQIQQFIETQKGTFQLLNEKKVYPSEGFDGFYMACLLKI